MCFGISESCQYSYTHVHARTQMHTHAQTNAHENSSSSSSANMKHNNSNKYYMPPIVRRVLLRPPQSRQNLVKCPLIFKKLWERSHSHFFSGRKATTTRHFYLLLPSIRSFNPRRLAPRPRPPLFSSSLFFPLSLCLFCLSLCLCLAPSIVSCLLSLVSLHPRVV